MNEVHAEEKYELGDFIQKEDGRLLMIVGVYYDIGTHIWSYSARAATRWERFKFRFRRVAHLHVR